MTPEQLKQIAFQIAEASNPVLEAVNFDPTANVTIGNITENRNTEGNATEIAASLALCQYEEDLKKVNEYLVEIGAPMRVGIKPGTRPSGTRPN